MVAVTHLRIWKWVSSVEGYISTLSLHVNFTVGIGYSTIITSMLVRNQTLLSISKKQCLTIGGKGLFSLLFDLFFQKCAFCHVITERYSWSIVGYDTSQCEPDLSFSLEKTMKLGEGEYIFLFPLILITKQIWENGVF